MDLWVEAGNLAIMRRSMVEHSRRDAAQKAMSTVPMVIQFTLATGGWGGVVRRITLQQLLRRLLELHLTSVES